MNQQMRHMSRLTAREVERLLSGTDADLGRYIANGDDLSRAEAETAALCDVLALTEVLSALDLPEAQEKAPPEHWSRLAWLASSRIRRVIALRDS